MTDQPPSALATSPEANRELVFARVIDAPRDAVWAAWTDPRQVERWWGPRGFTVTTTHAMEARPGGAWRFVMHGPDGVDYPNEIVYAELAPPARLVYDHGSGEAADPGRFRVTVTFEERAARTQLTMRLRFATVEAREQAEAFGAVELGSQTLDRLAEHLAGR